MMEAPDSGADVTDSSQEIVKYHRLAPSNAKTIDCNPVTFTKKSLEIQFTFSLPEQCKLTEGVKSRWQCAVFETSNAPDGEFYFP